MTLAQLRSFVLVARHGSVKAAAAQLGVTEPAVSVAVSALRKELGDELFVRDGRAIALTPGGHRLAALASEILGLAEQARRSVHESPDGVGTMHIAVTNVVAEYVGPLIDAFTTPGGSSESVRLYLARGLTPVAEADRHVGEGEEREMLTQWVSLREVRAAVLAGELHSPLCVMGILAAASVLIDGVGHTRPVASPWLRSSTPST